MRPDNEGGGCGGRGGDENTTAEEAKLVRLDIRRHDGGNEANDSYHCGGQDEKIPIIGRMRISKIIKTNFTVASSISSYPYPKYLLIPITTLILPKFPKTQIYWSTHHRLFCCPPPP